MLDFLGIFQPWTIWTHVLKSSRDPDLHVALCSRLKWPCAILCHFCGPAKRFPLAVIQALIKGSIRKKEAAPWFLARQRFWWRWWRLETALCVHDYVHPDVISEIIWRSLYTIFFIVGWCWSYPITAGANNSILADVSDCLSMVQ